MKGSAKVIFHFVIKLHFLYLLFMIFNDRNSASSYVAEIPAVVKDQISLMSKKVMMDDHIYVNCLNVKALLL